MSEYTEVEQPLSHLDSFDINAIIV